MSKNKIKLYLMKNELGLIKVGISGNPKKRRGEIQNNSGVPVEILSVYDVDDAPAVERDIHSHYASKRKSGEWFCPSILDTPSDIIVADAEKRVVELRVAELQAAKVKAAERENIVPEVRERKSSKKIEKIRAKLNLIVEIDPEFKAIWERLKASTGCMMSEDDRELWQEAGRRAHALPDWLL